MNNLNKNSLFFLIILTVYSLAGCIDNNEPTVLQGVEYELKDEKESDDQTVEKNRMIENIINEFGTTNDLSLNEIIIRDLDGDGESEYIGIFSKDSHIKALLVMNVEGDEVFPVEWRNYSDVIYYESLKIVEMKNSNKQYLYFDISNEDMQKGMAIYEMKRNSLQRLFYRYNLDTGMKHFLYDEEDDGFYDYAVSSKEIDDYQGHIVRSIYEWNGERFSSPETVILYNNTLRKFMMPGEPIGIVKSYVDAEQLNQSISLDEEMDMLVVDKDSLANHVKALVDSDEDRQSVKDKAYSKAFEFEEYDTKIYRSIVSIGLNNKQLFATLEHKNNWQIIDIYSDAKTAKESLYYYVFDDIASRDEASYSVHLQKSENPVETNKYQNVIIYKSEFDHNEEIFNLANQGINFEGSFIELGHAFNIVEKDNEDIAILEFIGSDVEVNEDRTIEVILNESGVELTIY